MLAAEPPSSRRVLAIALLVALVLIGLGAFFTLRLLDARDLLAGRLSALMEREVAIEKPIQLRLGLPPGLHLEGVRVGEAAGESPLRSIHIEELDLVFELWPLLRGQLDVHRLEIDGAEVVLELSAAQPAAPADSDGGGYWRYVVEQAELRDLKIELRREGGATLTTHIERISLRSSDEGREVEVEARGALGRVDFDLSGRYDRGTQPSGAAERGALALEGQIAGAHVSGQGSLTDANGTPLVDLRIRADAPHLQVFSGVAERELPQLGPVRGSGHLKIRGGAFGVSDLDVRLGDRETAWLELTGHVGDLRNLRQFALQLDFGIADVRSLGPLVGSPPQFGTVTGKASVHDRSGKLQVEEFTLKGGLPGVLEIDAEGRFEDVKGVHGLEARVDLKARDLASLGELFHRTLPPIGPVEFRGQITGHEGEVSAAGIRARVARTHFEGDFSGSLGPGQRPSFSGSIVVPELHLESIGLASGGTSEVADPRDAPEREATTLPRRLFSETRLDFAWLQLADARFSFRADRVLVSSEPIARDIRLDASLKDGKLSIGNAVFGYEAAATGSGEFELDSRTSPPTLSLRADVKDMQLGRLLEQLHLPRAYSGRVRARVDLQTRGDSPRALASHLGGEVSLTCGGGMIFPEYQSLQVRDLYQTVRRVVGGDREAQPFNCLIVGLEFRGGVGTLRPLILDADDHSTLGEGRIDLANETIHLRLVPKPHKASLLSTAATVLVVGPLTKPEVKLETGSLVTSSTRAVFDNLASASGARRIWKRFGRDEPLDSPCAKLMSSEP